MFNKEQLQRFSIRKLTVGAASVLIGVLFLTSWNTNTVYADSINVTSGESIAKNNNPQEGNPAVNKDNVQIVDNDSTEVSNISDSKSSKVIKSDATKSDIVRDKTTIDDNSGTTEHTAQANNKQALTTVTEDNGAKVSKTEKYSNSDIKKQPKNSEETQETTLVKKVLDKEKLSSENLIEEKLSSESLIDPKKDGKVEIRATDPSNTKRATDPSNYPKESNGLLNGLIGKDRYIYQVLSLDGGSKLILSVNRNDHNDKKIYAYVTDGNYKKVKQSKTIDMDQQSIITINGREYQLNNNGSSEVFIHGNKVSIQNSSTVTSEPGLDPWLYPGLPPRYYDNTPIGQVYGLGNTSKDNCSDIGEIVPVFTKNSVIKYYYRDNEGHLQEFKNVIKYYYPDNEGHLQEFKNSELPNVSVEGFTGQEFEIDNVAKYKRVVIPGYHLISDNIPDNLPKGNFNGTLSQFSDDKYYKKVYYDFHTGEVKYSVLYHQISPDGTMKVRLFDDEGNPLTESRVIEPNTSTEFSNYDNLTDNVTVRNPYVTAAPHEVQLIYAKNGKIIPVDKNGKPITGADQPVFPTNPNDPRKVESVEIPDLSAMGYHPLDKAVKTVDPDSKDPSKDIEVEYVKSGTISVKYHDNTEDKDIDGYGKNASGDEDDPFNYDPATDLATLKGKGYVLDGELPKIPDKFPDKDKTVIIPLKHGIVTVDTNNPQTPNTPINPNDPQSPKYPKDISNTNSDVKRTIDYKFKDGKTAQPTVNDSLHFERTVVIDKVTGDVLSDIWTPSQDFNDVQTPVIQGYTPDRTVVSDTNIGHDHQNIVEHVIYNPDAQHMTITYVDDTTHETLKQDKLDGTSDQDAKYTTGNIIKHYTDLHYKLVSDSTNGKDLIFDHDDKADQTYEVHFIHGTHTINQTTSPKQTVHYVYADGLARQGKAADDNVQQLSFKRDGYNDDVTGIDHWNAWTPANSQYKAVNSPVIQGYTPDKPAVEESTVNPTDKDTEITVVYSPDAQHMTITYVDDTTHETLKQDKLDGTSDKDAKYTTGDIIKHYTDLHYKLVSDSTNGKDLIFDHDDKADQTYEVHFVHGTQKVNRQDTVTSTIDYKFEDGKTAQPTVTQTKHFSEDGVKDLVTGKIAWDEAKPQKFDDVATPAISGYTPDKDNVAGSTVKFGDKDIEVTVTYHNNVQTAKITYIDDTEKKTLGSDKQNGKFNQAIIFEHDPAEVIKGLEEKGYKLVSDNFKPGIKYQNDNKFNIFEVHLVHTYEPVETSQTITETVHYIDANGKPVAPDHVAKVVIKVTGTRDKVTDSITWNTPSTGHFDEVISPEVPNMTPDKKLIPGRDVQYGDSDITESVVYTPDNSTSKTPEKPDKPSKEVSKIPEKPNKSSKEVSKAPEKSIDSRTVDNHVSAKSTAKRELPQTGATTNTGIWAGLVSMIASLGLLGASKKRKKN